MIIHVYPVSHISAVTIDGDCLAFQGMRYDERYEFLGELKGTVIVGAPGDDDIESVRLMIGPGEQVRRGLAGRIRTVGAQGRFLCEKSGRYAVRS